MEAKTPYSPLSGRLTLQYCQAQKPSTSTPDISISMMPRLLTIQSFTRALSYACRRCTDLVALPALGRLASV